MPDTGYILAVLTIAFVITFCLRAIPFAILKPLRESKFVSKMSAWMPAGILAILAATTLRTSMSDAPTPLHAAIAAIVTVLVHLLCGRRTLLSVGIGTLTFVVFVNLAG